MQSIEAAGIARRALDLPHVLVDELGCLKRTKAQCRQPPLVNLFIAHAFCSFVSSSFLAARQMIEGRDQALQFQKVSMRSAQILFKMFQTGCKQARVFFGIHGETVLMIEDAEFAFLFIESQLELAQVEDAAVLISENRDQDFSL